MNMNQIKTKIVEKSTLIAGTVSGLATTVICSPAFAALDTTGVVVDTDSFEAIALIVLGAGVGFWAIKKAIGLIGR